MAPWLTTVIVVRVGDTRASPEGQNQVWELEFEVDTGVKSGGWDRSRGMRPEARIRKGCCNRPRAGCRGTFASLERRTALGPVAVCDAAG